MVAILTKTPISATLCEPRWATPRTTDRPSFGPAIAAVAEKLGQPLMPWQRLVADVGGELLEDGTPAYREVVFTVPRQSGKTTVILGWQVQRAIGSWGGPQRIVYSAQTGNDARKKLIEDQVPLLRPRRRQLRIARILKGMGNEAVEFANGSRIVLLASSEDSGHGKTVDLGVKDELFADKDERRDQALIPAMATRGAAQAVTASTMGTADSVPLNRAVERGRESVELGLRTGIAYFEWSAEANCDPDDPAVWWSCMPALGHTIGEPVVVHARATLEDAEFRRAFLNIPDLGRLNVHVIPPDSWANCYDSDCRVDQGAWALDVSPDGASAAIGRSDGDRVFVVEHRPGTGWVLESLKARGVQTIAFDTTGPAGSLLAPLEGARVTCRKVSLQEHSRACGSFLEDANETRMHHAGQASLDAAVEGASRRPIGDAWLWSRKSSATDICPLVAVTLAKWFASQPVEPSLPVVAMILGGDS